MLGFFKNAGDLAPVSGKFEWSCRALIAVAVLIRE
jgi:hypothetical protein